MSDFDLNKHILDQLDDIKKTQVQHREEFLTAITEIKTEKKISAKISGGVWGFIVAAFSIAIKWLVDHFSR